MRLPRHFLRHRITVEPYLGEAGSKPLYGPPVQVPCHLEQMRQSSRRGGDREPRDMTRCIARIDDAAPLTLDARVTSGGRVVEVLSRVEHTYPGGPVPEHVEIEFA